MDRQSMNLSIALPLIENYYRSGSPVAEQYLQCAGQPGTMTGECRWKSIRNSRTCCSLIIRLFHGLEWDAELEAQWRAAVEKAAQAMFVGYGRRFPV